MNADLKAAIANLQMLNRYNEAEIIQRVIGHKKKRKPKPLVTKTQEPPPLITR